MIRKKFSLSKCRCQFLVRALSPAHVLYEILQGDSLIVARIFIQMRTQNEYLQQC
jgi:transposase